MEYSPQSYQDFLSKANPEKDRLWPFFESDQMRFERLSNAYLIKSYI
jgi:hypothetical protein